MMIDHGADLELRGYRLIATVAFPQNEADEDFSVQESLQALSSARAPVDGSGARVPWIVVHRDIRVVRRADDCLVYLRDRPATGEPPPGVHVLWLGPNASGYDRQDDPEEA